MGGVTRRWVTYWAVVVAIVVAYGAVVTPIWASRSWDEEGPLSLHQPALTQPLPGSASLDKENAVRHNVAEGGWLRVEVGDRRVRVTNSGEVIEPAEVEPLFEPFRRTGMARTRSDRGAGLGLAIVRSVAVAHGAKASDRARADGGLEVEVAFTA